MDSVLARCYWHDREPLPRDRAWRGSCRYPKIVTRLVTASWRRPVEHPQIRGGRGCRGGRIPGTWSPRFPRLKS